MEKKAQERAKNRAAAAAAREQSLPQKLMRCCSYCSFVGLSLSKWSPERAATVHSDGPVQPVDAIRMIPKRIQRLVASVEAVDMVGDSPFFFAEWSGVFVNVSVDEFVVKAFCYMSRLM
jgi:hypothetical protein